MRTVDNIPGVGKQEGKLSLNRVAQTGSLLYRGLVIRKRRQFRTLGRLPVGDTADCQSALHGSGDGEGQTSAFTLVEIIVVMALLTFIVLGLMAMFNQTQRAFRAGLMQTDILESGRLATDLIGRELEQVTPAYQPPYFYLSGEPYPVPNFQVDLTYYFSQSLPSVPGGTFRTNVLDDMFFLTRNNQTWTGIGYFARTNRSLGANSGPVCALYRYEASCTSAWFEQNPHWLYTNYNNLRWITNETGYVSKIIDGVVHFRIRPFDPAGWHIPYNPSWWPTNHPATVSSENLLWKPYPSYLNSPYPRPDPLSGEFLNYFFASNAVPASVEVEIGVLEQQTFERYRSIPNVPPDDRQKQYLVKQAGSKWIQFRQRVTVRNADSSAYQ